MKTKILITGFFLTFFIKTNAQISLDHFYTTDAPMHAFKLSLSGLKYYGEYAPLPTYSVQYFVLYNPDYTIFKTISVPQIAGRKVENIAYVSETLFDTDTLVEYLLCYYNSSTGMSDVRVLNENGIILLDVDSANYTGSGGADPYRGFIDKPIFPDGNQSKLYLYVNGGTKVFALPGQLPCSDCDNGFVTGLVINPGTSAPASIAYPNPSRNFFTIKYALPKHAENSFLEIYDLQGNLVKKSKINNPSGELIIYNEELSQGEYIYRIMSGNEVITSDKIVVTK